jgi:N-acetylglucosaminyl-diphospho-decaprenol L-rhamnosyltransferase
VVVHRDRPDDCARTVASLRAQGVERVIVVDNGSPQLPEVPGAELVELGYNAGFGPGANAGLRRWLAGDEGEWVLVCPHDAELADDCVARLMAAAVGRPNAGLASAEYGDHHWSGTPAVDPLFGALLRPSSVDDGWEDAGYPHGTLLLARRACLVDIGLFDERYFAYCEEADLGERARRAGWEVGVVRGAVVRNPGQGSGTGVPQYLMLRNTLQLVRRHFGAVPAATQFAVVLGITVRGVLGGTKAPFWHGRARWLALRDALLGRTGAPPVSLVTWPRTETPSHTGGLR